MRSTLGLFVPLLLYAAACTESEPAPPTPAESKTGDEREPYPEVPSLSDHVTAVLESATEIELFTVDPSEKRREEESFPPPLYWAFEDRKRIDRETFEPVLRLLYRALNETDGAAYHCFFPRHGVVARSPAGPEVRVLICFQCQFVEVWTDRGNAMTSVSIKKDLEPEFSALFTGVGLRKAEE